MSPVSIARHSWDKRFGFRFIERSVELVLGHYVVVIFLP
jgi:hypothetical protein